MSQHLEFVKGHNLSEKDRERLLLNSRVITIYSRRTDQRQLVFLYSVAWNI